MAEQHHRQQQQPFDVFQSVLPEKAPSASILVAITVLPLGGFLLLIAGLTLIGTLIGLAVTTPLFLIFSPVLVPAALTIALAIAGWIASGGFGLTALSAFAWMVNYLRQTRLPDKLEHAKRGAQDAADHLTQQAKETGQEAGGRD